MSPPRRRAKPTVLSAFTGAGGLDLGLRKAGFRNVGCIERDEQARQTIKANNLGPLLSPGDIVEVAKSLTPKALGLRVRELSVLTGAPPCQPFSKAAQWAHSGRAGLKDERSACVGAFFEIAAAFLPAVILIENVPGFVMGETSALAAVESFLNEINRVYRTQYRLHHTRLDSCDFGVPQRRDRAILVALRDSGDFKWPEPTHTDKPMRAYDAIGRLHNKELPLPTGKWARLLPSIPEGQNYLYHTPEGAGRPLFGRRTRFWSFLLKLAKDEPSWTLPAQAGPATGPFHWKSRPLTVKEMLRLQSFPASWQVTGARQEQVKQIGNATPPLLAEIVGRAIGEQVFDRKYDGRPKLSIARVRRVPAATPTKPVSPEYAKYEGAHRPHAGEGKGPKPIRRAAS